MRPVRRLVPLVLVAALAACGGSSPKPVDLAAAAKALTSARFAITIKANVAGISAETQESGTVSFTARQAHVYKLTGGSGQSTPIELIYDGDTVYSNANAMAALANPDVRPWIRQRRNATRSSFGARRRSVASHPAAARGALHRHPARHLPALVRDGFHRLRPRPGRAAAQRDGRLRDGEAMDVAIRLSRRTQRGQRGLIQSAALLGWGFHGGPQRRGHLP